MSAEILRQAAELMRERAEAVLPLGVWRDGEELPAADKPFTRYVASWTPAVALAVADLLDVWADHDLLASSGTLDAERQAVLSLARAYLGECS